MMNGKLAKNDEELRKLLELDQIEKEKQHSHVLYWIEENSRNPWFFNTQISLFLG